MTSKFQNWAYTTEWPNWLRKTLCNQIFTVKKCKQFNWRCCLCPWWYLKLVFKEWHYSYHYRTVLQMVVRTAKIEEYILKNFLRGAGHGHVRIAWQFQDSLKYGEWKSKFLSQLTWLRCGLSIDGPYGGGARHGEGRRGRGGGRSWQGGGVERQGERGGGDEKPVGLGHNGVGRVCKLPLENALHLGNPQNTS